LDKGHKDVKMTDEEMRKIRCWIDLGVPHWGTYQEAYPGSESNLTYRNTWQVQEKKNISDLLLTVGTMPHFDEHGRMSFVSGMRDFAITCSEVHAGVVRVHLSVPSYAEGQAVRIRLYNQKGALVSTLLDKPLTVGNNILTVNTGVRAAGQYLMELRSQGITKTLRFAILK
jgi:hypothetical protein